MGPRLSRRTVLASGEQACSVPGRAGARPPDRWSAGLASASGGWPGKAEDLLLLTERPPNLEMPAPSGPLTRDLTPNEAMFVRWHLAGLPSSVDERTFRLKVSGHVERPLELSLDDLKKSFAPVSITAVNPQVSGNGRGTFAPPVPGVQWKAGAIGNAKWTGMRLRDVLAKAASSPARST